MNNATRRTVLIGVATGAALPANPSAAVGLTSDDMAMGVGEAPVKLVLYASPTSYNCARWYAEVFPQIRSRYIDTGRVRLVLLEFVTPPGPVAEDGFLLARGSGGANYFPILADIFSAQAELQEAIVFGDYHDVLRKIGSNHGVSANAFAGLLSDPLTREALKARVERHTSRDRIDGVPTFIIGDRLFDGRQPFDVLASAIEEAERNAALKA